MLIPSSVEEQYARASRDNLRVLVIGAGMAGVTAAQLLRAQGRHPVLIERNHDHGDAGYMVALMPMVDAALDELGVRGEYRKRSVAVTRYGMLSHTGRRIRDDSLAAILDQFGDYRELARGELIDALTVHGCDTAFTTTVTGLTESASAVTAALDTDGTRTSLQFDVVIVADGTHSATRSLVLGDAPVDVVDTGWAGWVVWAPDDDVSYRGDELWGAGFFLGVYPVKDKLGVFLGGADADTARGPAAFVERVRSRLTTVAPRTASALDAVAAAKEPFYWPLKDCRTPRWAHGRTILLGDAAAGFLPTAGIGAGMAMESAWVLARMLAHADARDVDAMLRAFESNQRPRVESAQDASRGLAGLMFRQSRIVATIRDLAMRFASVQTALKPIVKLLAPPPTPDQAAVGVSQRA